MSPCTTCRKPRSSHTRDNWLACRAWESQHCMICSRPHSAHTPAEWDRCHTSCFVCKQPTDGHTSDQTAECSRLREEREQRRPRSPYCGVCLLEWDHPAAFHHVECIRRAELPIDVCHICARPMEDHNSGEVAVCASVPVDTCPVCSRPMEAHTPSQVQTCASAFGAAMAGRPIRAWLLRFPLNPRLWAVVALLICVSGWRRGEDLWALAGFLLVCGFVHTVVWNTVKRLRAMAALLVALLMVAAMVWAGPWLATWWPIGVTIE